MGNRQGSQKQKEPKSKEEKKREKEAKKDQEKKKKKREKQKKKKSSGGQHGSGLDTDLDESSHVTGGDSESSVFHSAENVSASPYLDSCTRSELEQLPLDASTSFSTRWAGPASSASAYQLHNQQYHQHHHPPQHHHHPHQYHPPHRDHYLQLEQQHPMVLSSKDFRDGFSLEACIPPEIARKETPSSYLDDTSVSSISRAEGRGRSGSSVKSKRSTTSESVKSKSSKCSHVAPPSSHHATPTSLRSHGGEDSASMTSSQTSAGGGVGGYSTPLLSTPVFGRMERPHSPLSAAAMTSSLARVQEVERGGTLTNRDNNNISIQEPSSPVIQQQAFSHHHPHFFNHQRSLKQQQSPQQQQQSNLQQQQQQQTSNEYLLIEQQQLQNQQQQQQLSHIYQQHPNCPDFRNLPKPASPHPQRRALSPKMTSAPFKLISSDDSSSSPSTPVPQRRAANFLDLLRPGSKSDKGSGNKKSKGEKGSRREGRDGAGGEWGEGASTSRAGKGGKSDSSTNTIEADVVKVKTKTKWKTWERSSAKKSGDKQSKVSMIFGTVRKTDKKKKSTQAESMSEKQSKTHNNANKNETSVTTNESKESSKNVQKGKFDYQAGGPNSPEFSGNNRNSSPPMVKSAAFCIMRLEELERNIENTIREKFPDAEPLLLKKRSKDEELKGSRSLPTTPSLKKKLYVARDVESKRHSGNNDEVTSNLNAVSSKLSEVKAGSNRGSDATYESLPSPAMSPVVLRRFGARTRHASISPKIQRAKTAALYSSPSEMSRVEESHTQATKTVTKVPVYRAISREQQKKSPVLTSSQFVSSLGQSKKSQSKYDNVNDESDEEEEEAKKMLLLQQLKTQSGSHQLVRQKHFDEYDSDEVYDSPTATTYETGKDTGNEKPVIVPTFSAVFGSVSPKLKRHLEEKLNEVNKDKARSRRAKGVKAADCGQRTSAGSTTERVEKLTRSRDGVENNTSTHASSSKQVHITDIRSFSLDAASGARGQQALNQNSSLDSRGVLEKQRLDRSPEMRSVRSLAKAGADDGSKVSVKERIKSINKSLSEGWGASGSSPGACPNNNNNNNNNTMAASASDTHSLSPSLSSSPRRYLLGEEERREGSNLGRPLDQNLSPPLEQRRISSPSHNRDNNSSSNTSPFPLSTHHTTTTTTTISATATASTKKTELGSSPRSISGAASPGSSATSSLAPGTDSPRSPRQVRREEAPSQAEPPTSPTQQHQANSHSSRPNTVCSPGGTRKHSIEHVVFGSAVALPCRLYAQPLSSSSLEENNEHKTSSTHAHPLSPSSSSPPRKQNRDRRNVVKVEKLTGEEDKKKRKENTSSYKSGGLSENTTGFGISDKSIACSESFAGDRLVCSEVKHQRSGICVESSEVIDDGRSARGAASNVNSNYNTEASARVIKVCAQSQHSARGETHPVPGDKDLLDFHSVGCDFNDGEENGSRVSEFQRQKQQQQQHEYQTQYREDEQKFVVLRQPVSKVICDMISTSKQTEQHQPQQQQQQQQKPFRQSSPTSPEQERHIQQAVAMVTSQTYEQPCLTLEEKTVRSDSSVSLPSSPICNVKRIERDFGSGVVDTLTTARNSESRSAGSQTDSYSTADKGVESADLAMYSHNFDLSPFTPQGTDNSKSPTSKIRSETFKFNKVPEDSDEETEFLKNVLAFKRTDCPSSQKKEEVVGKTEGDITEFIPPPPSPSAMDQLLEEFEEEDEDDDAQERKEIEQAMQKESEIREFTDKIYKRLSDLLGSQSGEGEDVDDDVFEEEEEEGGAARKRDVGELLSRLEDRREGSAEFSERREGSAEFSERREGSEEFSERREGSNVEFSEDEEEEEEEEEEDSATVAERIAAKAVVTSTKSPRTNRMKTVMTIQSSSSSITTTTSSSEDEEEAENLALANLILQKQQEHEEDNEGIEEEQALRSADILGFEEIEGAPKLKSAPNYFVFPEFNGERDGGVVDERRYSSSREYHSDDDVARGQGIPEYYDDRPLWSRKQKPPGQLSLDMMAMRRRERRERWLKKRRRNKTDLLSTASSDTGSETSLARIPVRLRNQPSSLDIEEAERVVSEITETRNDMGSGILSSPKYAKPILPFFNKGKDGEGEKRAVPPAEVMEERIQAKIISERLQAELQYSYRDSFGDDGEDDDGYSRGGDGVRSRHLRPRDSFEKDESSDDDDYDDDERGLSRRERALDSGKDPRAFMSDPDLAIPGIEETFNELMSVQHILEGMSDRAPSAPSTDAEKETKFMPLTKENVRSVREYYKDAYTSGNGRRSRLSNTDRTESDLDLYSETRDDASSDSNMYADDEGDEDGIDPYTTADDELGATGGSGSDGMAQRRRHRRDNDPSHTEDDNENANFVVGCTFYNSKSFPAPAGADSPGGGVNVTTAIPPATSSPVIGSSGLVTPSTITGTSPSTPATLLASELNSDEEFWAGSSAIEASYKQLESAADAVSSTFQNAREQMTDIQQHLQALRRQMEDLQDDLTSTSVTLTPDNLS